MGFIKKIKKNFNELVKEFPSFVREFWGKYCYFVRMHSGYREVVFAVSTLLLLVALFLCVKEAGAGDLDGWMCAICIVVTILWQISPFIFFPRSYGYGNVEKRKEISYIVRIWLYSSYLWGCFCTAAAGSFLLKGDLGTVLWLFLFLFIFVVALLFGLSTVDCYREWWKNEELEQVKDQRKNKICFVYEDGFESGEWTEGHGIRVGYRISPDLVVYIAFVRSEDREPGVLFFSDVNWIVPLTDAEFSLLRERLPEINALRKAAGYKAIAL